MSTAVKVACPHCGAALSTGGLAEGRPFRCPQCRSRVEYPPARSGPSGARRPSPLRWAALGGSASLAAVLSFLLLRLLLGPAGPAVVDLDPTVADQGWKDASDAAGPEGGPAPVVQLVPTGAPAPPLDFRKPVVLKGHLPKTVVVDVAYSPDGSKLASISNQGEVILWDLTSRDATVLTRPPRPDVGAHVQLSTGGKYLAFAPDGKTLYSGVAFETSAWNVDTTYGRTKFGTNPFHNLAGDIAVSPTGRFVAVVAEGDEAGVSPHRLVVWDAATRKEVARADFSDRPLHQLTRFTRDGRWLVLAEVASGGGEDARPDRRDVEASGVRLIDLTTGKVVAAGRPTPFHNPFALPGNRFFDFDSVELIGGGVSIRNAGLWTLPPGGGPLQHLPLPGLNTSGEGSATDDAPSPDPRHAVSDDGKYWTYRNLRQAILVRDGGTLKKVARVEEPGADFQSYILGDDSATLVALPYRRGPDRDAIRVLAFDLASGARRGEATIPMESADSLFDPVVAYTRARPRSAAVSTPDGAIVIQPLDGQAPAPKTWTLKDGAAGGTQLLTTAPRGFAPLQAKVRASLDLGFRFEDGRGPGNGAAFTPDGKRVVVGGVLDDGAAGAFVFVDPKAGRQEKVVTLPPQSAHPGTQFQFTPDGRYVVDDAYHVVDLQTGESTPLPDDLGGYADLDPSGKSLAVGTKHDGQGTPKVLEIRGLPSLKLDRSGVEFFRGEARAVKYSADGKHLAMAVFHDQRLGGDGKTHVLLVDPATCTVKHEMAKVPVGIDEFAFSPDGRTLAAVGHGGTAREHGVLLFDLAAKKLRYEVKGTTEPVFLARGRLLGATEVYDVGTGNLRAIVDPGDQHEGGGPAVEHVNSRCNIRACGHADGHVTLWVASRGVKVADFKAHPSPIRAIAISPDGGALVTVGQDNRLKIWSLAQ